MIKDNQWHDAFCVRLKEGNFRIYDTLAEVEANDLSELPEFQEVKYTWNKGEPIVDFGEFKMRIIDLNLQHD